MDTPLVKAVESVLEAFLAILPFIVYIAILIYNFYLTQKLGRFEPSAVFAYLGGFIIFVIGFAFLRERPEVNLGSERAPFMLAIISLGIGCFLGVFFFMMLKALSPRSNQMNWFIFVTNGMMSLAMAVYLFIEGIQDSVIWLTLGYTLGTVIYIISNENTSKRRFHS